MKKLVVVIASPPGSGGTTIARIVSRKLNLKFFSIGKFYKNFSKEKNESKAAFELWQTKFGSSEKIHKYMDNLQIEMAKKGNVVIESTLGINFLKKYSNFKVWLDVPLKIRAERTAKRDKIPLEQALKEIKEREKIERDSWKKIYGFDYFDQKKDADLVLDTSNLTVNQSVWRILNFIKNK